MIQGAVRAASWPFLRLQAGHRTRWRLLVTAADPLVHEAIRHTLAGSEVFGQAIDLLHAGDEFEAAEVMSSAGASWQPIATGDDLPVRVWLEEHRLVTDARIPMPAALTALVAGALRSALLLGHVRSLANFDQLSRLPNRPMFIGLLEEALRRHSDWVVAIVDIDHFSNVTNALGYRLGDALLRGVAQRLEEGLAGRGYQLARISTDNFAVLAPSDEFDIHQLQSLFIDPVDIGDYQLSVAITIGMVYARDASERSAEAVLRCAATALKLAKRNARGSFRCFVPNMAVEIEERVRLAYDLKKALAARELRVHYQPQVDLTSGRTVGLEALVRWPHAEFGMIPPDRFIGIAEHSGLIVELGEQVLEQACRDQVSLRAAGYGNLRMAVNVSMAQFRSPRFLPAVRRVIAETGIGPDDLELEITESMVINDVQTVIGALYAIKTLGVTVAIDDFGTGYSSLAHLHTLPIDRLKVDRSFVGDIEDGRPGGKIAEMIVTLARTLGKRVIAEGIEQPGAAGILCDWGCGEGQGYLYGRPMAMAELAGWLRQRADA